MCEKDANCKTDVHEGAVMRNLELLIVMRPPPWRGALTGVQSPTSRWRCGPGRSGQTSENNCKGLSFQVSRVLEL